jgi:hypothetical protein
MRARKLTPWLIAAPCLMVAMLIWGSAIALAGPREPDPPEPPETTQVSELTNTTAVLDGVLNPHGGIPREAAEERFVGWSFEIAKGPSCTGPDMRTLHVETYKTEFERAEHPTPQPEQAPIVGLEADTQYTYCMLAVTVENFTENLEYAEGNSVSFTTGDEAPTVGAESFSEATSSEASVSGQVDTYGSAGEYRVEYGTSEACFAAHDCSQTPMVSLGESSESAGASTRLEKLMPETTYYFRVAAVSAFGEANGAIATLSTSSLETLLGLPDGRVYEMVTPPGNFNADAYVQNSEVADAGHGIPTGYPFRAASNGGALAYIGAQTVGGNGDAGAGSGNQYIATRSTNGGWTQSAIDPPGTFEIAYQGFSSDLSLGILTQSYSSEAPPLAPEVTPLTGEPTARYDVLYERDNQDGAYRPMFTKGPLDREWYNFGSALTFTLTGAPEVLYAGSSASYEHMLFEANDAMSVSPLGGVTPVDGGEYENNLYDSVDGQLQLVNVLPNGTSEPNATFGGSRLVGSEVSNRPNFSHVISAEGNRVFWTSLEGEAESLKVPKALYVRENDDQPQSPLGAKDECLDANDACTVEVDASQGSGPSGGGQFWTASGDGSKAFFTDCSQLTQDSTAVFTGHCDELNSSRVTASLEGNDLYEYDVSTGTLTDLTVDHNASDKLGADVQGVIGASEDGEYVYFVADGVLANGATGEQPNLYLRHAGVTTFIATLSLADGTRVSPFYTSSQVEQPGDWAPSERGRTAQVTPDGHSLVFMSDMSLKGYPNEGLQEVYVYEAEGERLTCVSCQPGGGPPPLNDVNDEEGVEGAAGYIPISDNLTYLPRVISENGDRVFFNSPEPLVPQAVNNVGDVYEWERDGTGSCRKPGGCVFLLSSGTSPEDSYFIDASSSGDDVFIETRARLVAGDLDENFKVYDVRVDGVRPLSPSACSGTGCQGVPAAPPIFATPSSVTFDGVGNFPAPAKATPTPTAKPKPKKPKKKEKKKKTRRKARKGSSGRRTKERQPGKTTSKRGGEDR